MWNLRTWRYRALPDECISDTQPHLPPKMRSTPLVSPVIQGTFTRQASRSVVRGQGLDPSLRCLSCWHSSEESLHSFCTVPEPFTPLGVTLPPKLLNTIQFVTEPHWFRLCMSHNHKAHSILFMVKCKQFIHFHLHNFFCKVWAVTPWSEI